MGTICAPPHGRPAVVETPARIVTAADDNPPRARHGARMLLSSRILIPVLATLALAATAATASASSIVYVKAGDVWLSSPDGAKSYRVTYDGGYQSPSQADDGTIVAWRAKRFVRMDRSGRQLNAPVAGIGTDPGPARAGRDRHDRPRPRERECALPDQAIAGASGSAARAASRSASENSGSSRRPAR
jgi:hypothetical protein